MNHALTITVVAGQGLLPVLKATHEFVDARHAAAIHMDPEHSSDEEPAEILNEVDVATTEPVQIVLQEEIDDAIDEILQNLRDEAPRRPFEPALWDGVIAISPLSAWGVLTINGHELGKAFCSLNAKIQCHLGGPSPEHAHRFVKYLADMLAGIIGVGVTGLVQSSSKNAMGMIDNLQIPVDSLMNLARSEFWYPKIVQALKTEHFYLQRRYTTGSITETRDPALVYVNLDPDGIGKYIAAIQKGGFRPWERQEFEEKYLTKWDAQTKFKYLYVQLPACILASIARTPALHIPDLIKSNNWTWAAPATQAEQHRNVRRPITGDTISADCYLPRTGQVLQWPLFTTARQELVNLYRDHWSRGTLNIIHPQQLCMPETPTTVRVILCLTSQAKTRVQVNLAYLMQQLSNPLLPIPEVNIDTFNALMPEPLYMTLMKQYLVRSSREARELTPRMVEAIDTWAEMAFHAKFVTSVKKAMGEVPTSAEQSTWFGSSSASTGSTAKRSKH